MDIDDLYGVLGALVDGVADVPFIVVAFEERIQIFIEAEAVMTAPVQGMGQLIEIVDLDQILLTTS